MAPLRFLTGEELRVLTGYKQAKKQIELLTLRQIPFNIDAYGRPVVYAEACVAAPEPVSMYDQESLAAVLA